MGEEYLISEGVLDIVKQKFKKIIDWIKAGIESALTKTPDVIKAFCEKIKNHSIILKIREYFKLDETLNVDKFKEFFKFNLGDKTLNESINIIMNDKNILGELNINVSGIVNTAKSTKNKIIETILQMQKSEDNKDITNESIEFSHDIINEGAFGDALKTVADVGGKALKKGLEIGKEVGGKVLRKGVEVGKEVGKKAIKKGLEIGKKVGKKAIEKSKEAIKNTGKKIIKSLIKLIGTEIGKLLIGFIVTVMTILAISEIFINNITSKLSEICNNMKSKLGSFKILIGKNEFLASFTPEKSIWECDGNWAKSLIIISKSVFSV